MTNRIESKVLSNAVYYCPPPLVLDYGPNLESIERDGFLPGGDDDSGGSFPLRDSYADAFVLPTAVAKSNADRQYETLLPGIEQYPVDVNRQDQLIVTGPSRRMVPTGGFRLRE